MPAAVARMLVAPTAADVGSIVPQYTSRNVIKGALIAVTVLLGAATAAALAAALPPGDLTFAALSDPVQSLMSVLVPLLGILLVRDATGLRSSLAAAVPAAAAVGAFGALACAAALAVASPDAAGDPWAHAAVITLGGVLVQVLAMLVGTGLGLLLRSVPVAFAATFVPLVLWIALAPLDGLRPWLTPYETARHLLSGQMDGLAWLQWLVVVLLWGAGPNVAGAARRFP